jgi:hypothetical protein
VQALPDESAKPLNVRRRPVEHHEKARVRGYKIDYAGDGAITQRGGERQHTAANAESGSRAERYEQRALAKCVDRWRQTQPSGAASV